MSQPWTTIRLFFSSFRIWETTHLAKEKKKRMTKSQTVPRGLQWVDEYPASSGVKKYNINKVKQG